MLTGYLAPESFEKDLSLEIQQHSDLIVGDQMERLFVVEGPEKELAFSQVTLKNLQKISIASITDAAKALRAQGALWVPYSHQLHRRVALIQEKLPKVRNAPQKFGSPPPDRSLGTWTLKDSETLYLSSQTTSPYPLGEIDFEETKEAPSRAYMKLWEYFTLTGIHPRSGDKCIDLGSCPGGWTWVLSNLGCDVISVDKAPLAASLSGRQNIRYLKKDAFTLKPQDIGPIDWLFSDIICYPAKLLELVQTWRQSGLVKNFVCTIKFQGETDFESLKAFQSIAGSHTQHLFVNKHEVTWSLLDKKLHI